MVKYTFEQVKLANKKLGPFLAVFFFYPISNYIVYLLSNYTSIKPTQVTVASLVIGFYSIFFVLSENFLYSSFFLSHFLSTRLHRW